MVNISINKDVKMTLSEFKKTFESSFKHIPERDKKEAMKASYDQAISKQKTENNESGKEMSGMRGEKEESEATNNRNIKVKSDEKNENSGSKQDD
jgi:hypothetical protein